LFSNFKNLLIYGGLRWVNDQHVGEVWLRISAVAGAAFILTGPYKCLKELPASIQER